MQATVWYDGRWPSCRREIGMMQRFNRKAAIDFFDATSSLSFCPIDRADLRERVHAQKSSVMLISAAAFAAMWRSIRTLTPLALAARLPWVLVVRERGNRLFLPVRPRLRRFYAIRRPNP
jgi:predicted DCC family thiol-disulfide oxidoreductase YuxK